MGTFVRSSLHEILAADPLIVAITFLGAMGLGLVWLLAMALRRIRGHQ